MRRVIFSSSGDLTRREANSGSAQRRGIASLLGTAAESLFSTVFPSDCRFCGAPLERISRIPVCQTCLENMRALEGPVCSVCGQPLSVPQPLAATESYCVECSRQEPPFTRALAYGGYEGGLRELIHLLKYERVRPAASVLGRMLAEVATAFTPQFGAAAPIVIPVPLHNSKLRQRGFNQSEAIARAAVKQLPVRLLVNTSALIRRRATESQTGLSRPQRRLNMRGAFALIDSAAVAGRDILLIDDVLTTGTTVSECARVLRRGGAERIWVATVARVLKPESAHALPPGLDVEGTGEDEAPPIARAAQA